MVICRAPPPYIDLLHVLVLPCSLPPTSLSLFSTDTQDVQSNLRGSWQDGHQHPRFQLVRPRQGSLTLRRSHCDNRSNLLHKLMRITSALACSPSLLSIENRMKRLEKRYWIFRNVERKMSYTRGWIKGLDSVLQVRIGNRRKEALMLRPSITW